MKKVNLNFIIGFMGLVLLTGLYVGIAPLAYAQETGRSTEIRKTTPPSTAGGQDRRIIILGTTIRGSIAKPRVVYEVPWKAPESLKKELAEPQRSFDEEIFMLLDKAYFEAEGDESP